jgi:hypothetical protein
MRPQDRDDGAGTRIVRRPPVASPVEHYRVSGVLLDEAIIDKALKLEEKRTPRA